MNDLLKAVEEAAYRLAKALTPSKLSDPDCSVSAEMAQAESKSKHV